MWRIPHCAVEISIFRLTFVKGLVSRGSVPVIGGPLQILAPCVASCYVQFLPQSGCKSDDLGEFPLQSAIY